ncbi:MAG: gamma-glutamyl-gamma-aminobutyrate hydrolase family protein, partial [Candidatus Caldarchaeum sp.]
TRHPLVGLMEEWTRGNEKVTRDENTDKGGTMRLGAYPARLKAGSRVAEIYGSHEISERHRHRYEVNNDYRETLEAQGMICCGVSPDYRLVEMVELKGHPFFIGTQAHPEFKSRPNRPHPLFAGLVEAALKHKGVLGHEVGEERALGTT